MLDIHRTDKLFPAVAAVLSNWHNVLRAIHMASSTYQANSIHLNTSLLCTAKLPKPKEDDVEKRDVLEAPLPQTLVRIPTQHAPALLEQASVGASTD